MNRAAREAIARIDVIDPSGQVVSRGTGTLVAPGMVLTALHVVADRRTDPPQRLPGRIILTFPSVQVEAELHATLSSAKADWVILLCPTTPTLTPVTLGRLAQAGVDWETFGFPDANPRDGMVQTGRVEAWDGILDGETALQLFSEEAAAGNGAPVKGLSGAPVFVADYFVGHMRFALMQDGKTVAGTLYACPVVSVEAAHQGFLTIADVPVRRSTVAQMITEMRQTERGTRRLVMAGLVVLALLVSGIIYATRSAAAPRPAINTVAVLPLRNATADSGRSASLAGGVRSLVLAELRRIRSIRVIDLDNVLVSSIGEGSAAGPNLAQAGVHADAALQSEVLMSGADVSIRLTLLQSMGRANAWNRLWQQTYDVHGNTAFQIQQDVARKVANELEARLTSRDSIMLATVHTGDSVAAEFFLLGKDLLARAYFDADAARRAAVMFSRAVDRDPGFAVAYARLSDAHSLLHYLGVDQSETRGELALAAADTALALNPDLPEGHLALGAYYYRVAQLAAPALRELAVAARALPDDASALLLTGLVLRRQDRWADAACALRRASDLEPGNWGPAYYAGETLLFMREFAEAARYLDRAIGDSIDATGLDERARAFVARATLTLSATGDSLEARAQIAEMFHYFSPTAVLDALSHDQFRPLLHRVATPALDSLLGDVLPAAGSDTSDYYLTRAILAEASGKNELVARAFYTGALAIANSRLAESPLSVSPHADRAVALAGLGRIPEARTESGRAVALFSQGGLITGSRTVASLAVDWTHLRLLLRAGDRVQALARIRKQLEGPGLLSPDWIQSDPAFAPVLALPEYHAMKQEYYGRLSYGVLHHGADPHSVTCPTP
jgi:serine/threonine-protein kinase